MTFELGERSDSCKESWGLRFLQVGLERRDAGKLLVTTSGEPKGRNTRQGAECEGTEVTATPPQTTAASQGVLACVLTGILHPTEEGRAMWCSRDITQSMS